jgi:hypothetical protein
MRSHLSTRRFDLNAAVPSATMIAAALLSLSARLIMRYVFPPIAGLLAALVVASGVFAKEKDNVTWPPKLPGGKEVITINSPDLLKPVGELAQGVKIARTAPTVDFLYYDCQTYAGNPWSVWGDGCAAEGKYYSAVGDHKSPMGNAFVYEYDVDNQKLRKLVDVRQVLNKPDGWYTPGKIHSHIDLGSDGWLYFTTHRGSTRVAENPENHFEGDWILKANPATGKTEIIAHAPLKMQCLPAGRLDPERLIWYAGSADGLNKGEPQFLAYDLKQGKAIYQDGHGPYRDLIISRSTGKMYFHGESSSPGVKGEGANLYRFDPEKPGKPVKIDAVVGLRAASDETPQGLVYTVDHDHLWSFDVKTEKAQHLGSAAVATQTYTTSIDADPTGRYLYYIPGAHGGAERDGTPVIQYDTKTSTRKVLCFLHPVLWKECGYVPIGTFGSAVSPDGSMLYVTWNGAHEIADASTKVPFRSVAMTVIHIPETERQP